MQDRINQILDEKISSLNELKNNDYSLKIENISNIVSESIKSGNKLLIAGNGGSAADAQHFAAEIVGRFVLERKGYPAIALTTDTSILTAIGNDYSYDEIFSRQIEALGKPGDVFIGISTSGNSKNIIKAVEKAKELNIKTISFTGHDGGIMKDLCDENLIVNGSETSRIQENHLMSYHIICEFVEKTLKDFFGD